MQIEQTALPGVVILIPPRFEDSRGFFSESWNKDRLAQVGLNIDFVQDNHSLSVEKGTVRGLHFQSPPHAQTKLVRCGRGALFDVAVDIRDKSPTFGQWVGVELTEKNGKQLLIPEGFLHGFQTLTENTEICYKCSDYYAPKCDRAVHWDSCGINWPLEDTPVLSEKDANAVRFSEFSSPFIWSGNL